MKKRSQGAGTGEKSQRNTECRAAAFEKMMYFRTWQTTWQSDCQDRKQYPLWDTILKPVSKHMATGKPITGEETRGKCPVRYRNRERQQAIGRGDGDTFLFGSSKIDSKPTFFFVSKFLTPF